MKLVKRIIYGFVLLMALVGVGGITAFAAGHIEWGGSDDFRQALENMNLIQTRAGELKTERDSANQKVSDLESKVSEQKKKIKTQQQTIEDTKQTLAVYETQLSAEKQALVNMIADANNTNGKGQRHDVMQEYINSLSDKLGLKHRITHNNEHDGKSNQLEQAEEDMGIIKDKSEEVLNSLN